VKIKNKIKKKNRNTRKREVKIIWFRILVVNKMDFLFVMELVELSVKKK
jgi:hypothetical protein